MRSSIASIASSMVSWSTTLGALLHASQHAPIHHEAYRLHQRRSEPQRLLLRVEDAIPADESRPRSIVERLEEEEPAHRHFVVAARLREDPAARLDVGDRDRPHVGMKPERVPL